MENDLKKSILSTIVFFDMFDYPLTKEEIWKFLYFPQQDYSLDDVKKFLDHGNINHKEDFYFLSNREEIINTRKKREKESLNKYKKTKRVVKVFGLIPFVQVVAIGNFMPQKNTRSKSDLDFFIVTKKNRIWLTRFITILLSYLFGGRPTPKNQKNKICLTFYTSEDNLNFQNIALHKNDIYFHYWLASLVVLYNKNQTCEKFIKENEWLKKYLPNVFKNIAFTNTKTASKKQCRLVSRFEKLAKKIQLKKMPKHLKEQANKNTNIIINDKMLKFHDKDKRKHYYNKFLSLINRVY